MAEPSQRTRSTDKSVSVMLVTDGGNPPDVQAGSTYKPHRARYTKSMLRSTLQLMGCKPRTAHKVSERVFRLLDQDLSGVGQNLPACLAPLQNRLQQTAGTETAIALCRQEFEDLVIRQVEAYTEKPADVHDLRNACSIQEQRSSVTVLLAGTSGTGKSTLAGLLAARLGITTVLSTDNIRHMLRSFADEDKNPLLWASTYQAGDLIQLKESAKASVPATQDNIPATKDSLPSTSYGGSTTESNTRWDAKKRAVKGYKAQSEMVMESLDRLISSCAARRESLVCEGVHLSLNFVVELMQRHPSIVPFLIYISNEDKHKERFAVRAKYMTLDPAANRYVKYIRNIRTIQDYLCRRADKHMIPKVDNTNVDRSVATIHATVLACLRHTSQEQSLLDSSSMTTRVLAGEYLRVKGGMWSSKSMLQIIRSKALANIAVSTTDSDYPSTSNSSPKGPLPMPERWQEGATKGVLKAEETDIGSSDQEVGSTSSAGAAAPDPDVEETGSVDEESVALEHDEETSTGSVDEDSAAAQHEDEEASTAPGSGLMMSGGPSVGAGG